MPRTAVLTATLCVCVCVCVRACVCVYSTSVGYSWCGSTNRLAWLVQGVCSTLSCLYVCVCVLYFCIFLAYHKIITHALQAKMPSDTKRARTKAGTEDHIRKITSYEHFAKDFIPKASVGRCQCSKVLRNWSTMHGYGVEMWHKNMFCLSQHEAENECPCLWVRFRYCSWRFLVFAFCVVSRHYVWIVHAIYTSKHVCAYIYYIM